MVIWRGRAEYRPQQPLSSNELLVRYRALRDDGRPVEVHVFNPQARVPEVWDRLVQRMRLVRLLRHAAIRAVLDLQVDPTQPFVVVEWCEGATFAAAAAQRTWTWEALGSLAGSWCSALAEAHSLGCVHGDLRPEAIVLRGTAEWLLDFTRWEANDFGEAAPSRFRAPEIATGDQPEPTSDLYSVAACVRWLAQQVGLEASQVPAELDSWLQACLAESPSDRPTASESMRLLARRTSVPGVLAVAPRIDAAVTRADHQPTWPPADEHPNELAATIAGDKVADSDDGTAGELPLPTRLGRFELEERLGSGGMGTVYRARDLASEAPVAVKLLRSRIDTAHSHRRFAKEARLLAQASNPYLANLIDFNEHGGRSYLAVEFVAGGSLGQQLNRIGALPERVALALLADAARGLAIAHQRGIVHRDIKPDNLLLTTDGLTLLQTLAAHGPERTGDWPIPAEQTLAKLADFGLAGAAEHSESLAITQAGALLGTPLYMSPEQCRGEPLDRRADVYSLGATLFHLLAGRPPFGGDTPMAVMHRHCHEAVPSLAQIRPELGEATIRVVEKCLAKNPDARYADADELLLDLERLLHGEPTSLRLHPPAPTSSGQELEFSFSCDLQSPPARLWPYVSNTDRVNHALGLPPVTYTTRSDGQGGVERIAETRVAGQRLRWREHPYEWVEGQRLSVLREFSAGPFRWFVNVVELAPREGGGTRLTQTFRVAPRGALGRLLARWELGNRAPRNFRATYQRIDQYLEQAGSREPTADPFTARLSLSSRQRSLLQQRTRALKLQPIDPLVVDTLAQFLEHASDVEVARLRPRAFAERFDLPSEEVIKAFLYGAREGLLVLLWDILCPTCRIPADVLETLGELREHSYCPACDLKYAVDLATSVEMIGRAHPEIRRVETRTYCIGGPAFSSHVVAQLRLGVGERFALDVALEEGVYRLRGPQLSYACDFRVSPRGVASRWEVPLLRPPPRDSIPTLQAGRQVLQLWNNTPGELLVRIERTAGRSLAFTAAEAATLALFREMFPDQVLSPGRVVSVATVTFLLVRLAAPEALYTDRGDGEAFATWQRESQQWVETVERRGGAVVQILPEGLLASFSQTPEAVQAAVDLMSDARPDRWPVRMVVHRGAAIVATANDRLEYFGAVLHEARQLLAAAEPDELLVTAEVACLPETNSLARAAGLEVAVWDSPQSPVVGVVQSWQRPKSPARP